MRTARIPAPGPLLGAYPEVREHQAPSLPERLFARIRVRGRDQDRNEIALIRKLAPDIEGETPPVLRQRISALRARLARDGFVAPLTAEALAVVVAGCRRELGLELYDTQLAAARIMLDGHLAEMATGEGKTVAVAAAAASAALAGVPVHVITANDYLVGRDAAMLRPLYHSLGLSLGAVTQPLDAGARRAAYRCDITYCTAKELVFDYLRDGVSGAPCGTVETHALELTGAGASGRLLRGLCMAIIDETDSVLIDEARVPFILSQNVRGDDPARFQHAWTLALALEPDRHFIMDATTRGVRLTDPGRLHLRGLAAQDTYRWCSARHCEETVTLALIARHLLVNGRDFLVKDGRIHIIDGVTGRTAHGRSWSQGLQQLVEIKECCAPSAPVMPVAQITYQRFFRRYLRLCGVSGTLQEARGELLQIYGQRVVKVPLLRCNRRRQLPTRLFACHDAQWAAVVARVGELNAMGRPVLIGTDSVLESEALSQRLKATGLQHAVLNARQDQHEARIIAAAGAPHTVTVATNMAGRGTDIVLTAATRAAGGLHVICCQQNAARRIDRQLAGRCARQGDPGSVETYLALDGGMLARFWISRLLGRYASRDEMHLAWLGMLALRCAQIAEERRHRLERKLLLESDRDIGNWLAFSGPEA